MTGTDPGCIHWAQLRKLLTFSVKWGLVKRPNHTPRERSAIRLMSCALPD